MTEAEVLKIIREHVEGQFPKVCPTCNRAYVNLRDYILNTERIEPTICYDAEADDWKPMTPLGTVTCNNCPCGTTLAISSHGIPLLQLWVLYGWAKEETRRRRIPIRKLLSDIRDEICKQVLTEPDMR